MVKTYAARRRIKIGTDEWREPAPRGEDPKKGQLVPEAHLWSRNESWLHTGYLIETEVSEEDFRAALDEFEVSDTAREQILARVGLGQDTRNVGVHKSPQSTVRPPLERPEQKEFHPNRLTGAVPRRPERRPSQAAKAPAAPKSTAKAPGEKLRRKKNSTDAALSPLRELTD